MEHVQIARKLAIIYTVSYLKCRFTVRQLSTSTNTESACPSETYAQVTLSIVLVLALGARILRMHRVFHILSNKFDCKLNHPRRARTI